MADAFPMICRSVLGQGGGPHWLDEMAETASHAARLFGRHSVQARELAPVVLEPEPVTHSTLAAWALNLSVVKELAEPTREEL